VQFSYKAKTKEGATIEGNIAASSRTEAISILRSSHIIPFIIEQKISFSFNTIFGGRVTLAEKILFTKNLSGMVGAGLSLSRGLQVLIKQTHSPTFKKVIESVLETIDKGGTLSAALEKHPKVFSKLFVAMVRAGEESGGLPVALKEVGESLEKTYALNRKVKSALMYPMIIVCAIVLIAILMFIYVVPTLIKTFRELGAKLPFSTQCIIWTSDFISNHIVLLIVFVALVVVSIQVLLTLPKTKIAFDWISLRIPVVKDMLRELYTARAARTLSLLLSSGVNISHAISITSDVLQNSYYKSSLADVATAIEKGEPIASVFIANEQLYPPMMGEMIAVGEETGKLQSMLFDVAVFYEGEVQAKTANLSTIVEPVLMIFIGAAVGFFAVSMLTPMYSIMDSIK
jgi:type IV pilus assembly protein PilC